MNRLQINSSRLAIVIVMLFGDLFIGVGHVMASEISLRPPYDGQHPLTSFFRPLLSKLLEYGWRCYLRW
jgi:hypothetical protein